MCWELSGCACRLGLRLAFAGLVTLALVTLSTAATLVSEEEAQLPRDESQLRAPIERGPDIIAVYPAPNSGLIQSPFRFRVRFQAHGNTQIDLSSLVVTYKSIPSRDLTERVRASVNAGGIDMSDAQVPPGKHRIWIFVRDSAGHQGRADIRFDVAK